MGTVLKNFLSDDVIVGWLSIATPTGAYWEIGRQGTGYDKAYIGTLQNFPDLRTKLEHILPDYVLSDVWLVRYPTGSFIPKHKDPVKDEEHFRINILLKAPESGGELWVDGKQIDLEVGDAFLFRPDLELHQVSKVVGERLILSIGCLTKKST